MYKRQGLGCALPLLLGLFTAHSGFLWASAGAFQAAQANPLHRFGMLRMLLLTGLGACSAGLGFWAGSHPLVSLGIFAAFGLLLAWLQRFGSEAGKLGIEMCIRDRPDTGRQPARPMPAGSEATDRTAAGGQTDAWGGISQRDGGGRKGLYLKQPPLPRQPEPLTATKRMHASGRYRASLIKSRAFASRYARRALWKSLRHVGAYTNSHPKARIYEQATLHQLQGRRRRHRCR